MENRYGEPISETVSSKEHIPVVFAKSRGLHKVLVNCPFCHKTHQHDGTGYQTSNCKDPNTGGTYEIRMPR